MHPAPYSIGAIEKKFSSRKVDDPAALVFVIRAGAAVILN